MNTTKGRPIWVLMGFLQLPYANARGQEAEPIGEQCVYQALITNPLENGFDNLKKTRRISTDPRSYLDHPLHKIVQQARPGISLEAHSKALLRIDPEMQLVAQFQDSTYFARPGARLVQMVFENRVRRSIVIPDSLFLVPEKHYVFSAQVTLDFILGKLPAYRNRSSRLVGIYRMEIQGISKVVAVISHDYLLAAKSDLPELSIAVFSPGLFLEDLIRLHLNQKDVSDPMPTPFGKNGLFWETNSENTFDILLRQAPESECIPLIYVPVL